MSKTAVLEPRFVDIIASEVSCRPQQVEAAAELFAEGATVPFVARYRKEATGGLDELQLETIWPSAAEYFLELDGAPRRHPGEHRASRASSPPSWRPPSAPPSPSRSSRTSTSPTSPSAAPAPRSPARRGWSRWPTHCWPRPPRATCPRSWPRRSSTPRRASRTPRPPSPARATSWPSGWPRTPPSAPSCAARLRDRGGRCACASCPRRRRTPRPPPTATTSSTTSRAGTSPPTACSPSCAASARAS